MEIDLYAIFDEFALRYCVSPPVVIKKIKEFLNFVVRTSGIISNDERILVHNGF